MRPQITTSLNTGLLSTSPLQHGFMALSMSHCVMGQKVEDSPTTTNHYTTIIAGCKQLSARGKLYFDAIFIIMLNICTFSTNRLGMLIGCVCCVGTDTWCQNISYYSLGISETLHISMMCYEFQLVLVNVNLVTNIS